jgi:hypothetical protein
MHDDSPFIIVVRDCVEARRREEGFSAEIGHAADPIVAWYTVIG